MSKLIINANSIYDRVIRIGRQTENLVSSITFNVNMWIDEYGAGECVLNVKRNGDGSAYPVPMTITDGLATWTINDTDTAKKGRGEIQLFYTVGEKVKTSSIFTISCGESLVGGEVPEPYEDWLTELNQMTAQVEAAKTSADQSAQTATEKALEAEQSATTASRFANDASASAQSANTSAQAAALLAQQAAESASDASASAQAASQSAQSAESAKQAAQTAESNAHTSEQIASEKASQAAESAAQAQESVTDAQSEVAKAKDEADRAKTYADRAAEVELEIPTKVSQLENDAGYLTEHQSLSDYVRKDVLYDMLPTDTAEGAIASFPDGADDVPVKSLVVGIEPVQDLHGYDNPWPAGGGINKLNIVEMSASDSTYGFITTIDGEDFVFSGTYTGTVDSPQFRFAFYTDYREIPYKLKGFAVDTITAEHYTGFVGRADNNKRLTIQFRNCIQGETYNFRVRVVAYEGDTVPTSWTPYSNICPISGFDSVKVTRTGKNLCSVNSFVLEKPNTRTKNILITPIPAGTYTISWKSANSTSTRVQGYGDSGVSLFGTKDITNTGSAVITISEPLNRLYVYIATTEPDGVTASFSGIQIELGSTATAYEPYQGQTYDITFPSEAGTVYGGTLDVVSGELVVDRSILYAKDVNFTFNPVALNDGTGYYLYRSGVFPVNSGIISNMYVESTLTDVCENKTFGEFQRGTTTLVLTVPLEADTLAKAKEWLTENNPYFVYPLATPITYQLTPQEVETLLGVNNIWADTGDTNVVYRADTSAYIAKKNPSSIPTVTNDFTDAYKNKVDALWSDYQSALTAMGL